MLSPAVIKRIRSLKHSKNRTESGLFVAEGPKVVNDLILNKYPVKEIYGLKSYTDSYRHLAETHNIPCTTITEKELSRLSRLSMPNEVLALCEIINHDYTISALKNKWTLVLDGINTPGNLGTIIRIAHWMAIEHIVCSPDTVDVYNNKCIQATMGSVAHVKLMYTPLPAFLEKASPEIPVFGAFLEGQSLYDVAYPAQGIFVLGSEAHGISKALAKFVRQKIKIPRPLPDTGPDSLNVAIATGMITSELLRCGALTSPCK